MKKSIAISVALVLEVFFLTLPMPLVDFCPVQLQPPCNLSDPLRVPHLVFEVLILQYFLLFFGESRATDLGRSICSKASILRRIVIKQPAIIKLLKTLFKRGCSKLRTF